MIGDQTIVNPPPRNVRRILHTVLTTASNFEAFCIDYFPTIQQQFSNGMDREAKINLLLTCAGPKQVLRKLRQAYPNAAALSVDGPDESAQHSALAMRQQLLSQRLAHLLTERDTLSKYHANAGQLDREIAAAQRDLRHGPQLNPGEIVADRYQLKTLVGQGAVAQVWEARNLYPDDAIPATVAVKVLHGNLSRDRTCLSRFVRGSQQMKRLCHPHIARVYLEASQYQGFHFFVMELFPDGDLHAAVLRDKEGRQRDKWLRAALQAGEALIYAHGAGCIHRDVKPHNILLDAYGNARLGDFDLAQDERARVTHSNVGFGAADYAAPEALRNAAHVDQRADQFGLGRTVLFLYFGKDLPGESINAQKAFINRLPVTAAIKAVLETATAWEAHERFQSIQEFCDALRAASACSPIPADASGIKGKAAADSPCNPAAPLPERRELLDSGPLARAGFTLPALKSRKELLWMVHAKTLALRLLRTRGRLLAHSALLLCFALGLSGPLASSRQGQRPPLRPKGGWVKSIPEPPHSSPPEGRPDQRVIRIAGGSAQIGTREGARDNEQPAYTRTLKPFFIEQTEVTVAAYRVCTEAKHCSPPGTFAGCNWEKPGADDHPINCVDWQQASEYCAWIHRRLPTEEEWEYAARGAAGRRFVWGEHPENRDLCWARAEGTCPVTSHPDGATPEGVRGMLDNVKEYTADPYRRCYASDCPTEQNYHTVRGGSYDMGFIDDFYSARRYRRADNDPSATIGFRCVQ